MKDYDASQLSPEAQTFLDAIAKRDAIASIAQIVEQQVQSQLENHLLEFQSKIAQSNAVAVELMLLELKKLKDESATLPGVMEKLSSAIAPELPVNAEVVTFRQAIENLQTYGSILPSNSEIVAAQLRLQQNHAWSLFRQAIAKFIIKKLERIFCKPPISTELTGTTEEIWG